jgi:hypothetical protein
VKKGINQFLWMPDKGYYAQYLYGRPGLTVSPRFEALGEALSILFDVADQHRADSILSKSPVTEFGVTCIYPQIPGIPPYHNNAIWPFVQSYWNLAAAKSGNEAVLTQGLSSVYRAGALFLTNYENFVAETGDYVGTEINSDRMLWSMAGNLSMVHRVFMGMSFETDGLYFHPVIPSVFDGDKTLSNFKYRNAILNITVKGFGNSIRKATLDGKQMDKAFLPTNISGRHDVIIEMADNVFEKSGINKQENHFSLPAPQAQKNGDMITWAPVKDAVDYRIYKNGVLLQSTKDTMYKVAPEKYAEYKISAMDDKGYESFTSEPVSFALNVIIAEMENFALPAFLPYTNYSGRGFVEMTLSKNTSVLCKINVAKAGNYLIDLRYSNGSGPWNTDNKCAIRSLSVNDVYAGVLVMPQRGKDEWSDWGFSNSRKVQLKQGENIVKISMEDWNNNMNVDVNTAMVDYIRITSIDN